MFFHQCARSPNSTATSPATCSIGTLQELRYSVIAPDAIRMLAGRMECSCHGTTPAGWTTSLRMRSRWPFHSAPLDDRSMLASTSSVTPAGMVAPGFVAPAITWSAGHSPAPAGAAARMAAEAIATAAASFSGLMLRLANAFMSVFSVREVPGASGGACDAEWPATIESGNAGSLSFRYLRRIDPPAVTRHPSRRSQPRGKLGRKERLMVRLRSCAAQRRCLTASHRPGPR